MLEPCPPGVVTGGGKLFCNVLQGRIRRAVLACSANGSVTGGDKFKSKLVLVRLFLKDNSILMK